VRLQRAAARQGDRSAAQALHGEGEIGQAVVIRERFADEANGPRIEVRQRTSELERHAVARQTGGAQAGDQISAAAIDRIAGFGVRIPIERGAGGPRVRLRRDRAVRRLEEGQRQQVAVIAGTRAHRPTNCG